MRSPVPFLLCLLLLPLSAGAFCGFYVAKADTELFNQASKVVIARDGDRTTLTMANDYQGDLKEFATVFPVPVVLRRNDIRVADSANIDHIDRYTAPRLVEYFDPDPCAPPALLEANFFDGGSDAEGAGRAAEKSLGVTVEAEYQVGEYEIVVLSADQSDGLQVWLRQNGYRLPEAAKPVLGSYIKQRMKFFVAKVNLARQSKLGYSYLRPLQVTYRSPKFALPIRLGTVNAKGDQELFAFVITRGARVECTNYKTVRIPTGDEVPIYIKDEFGDFYRDLFAHQHEKNGRRAVFMEYAWDMNWCDPCAADPLSRAQLSDLGCHWLDEQQGGGKGGGAVEAFVTRLHLRYNTGTFPEDLQFQETGDKTNFQGRYVLRHPFRVTKNCDAVPGYLGRVKTRWKAEIGAVSKLTGTPVEEIAVKHGRPFRANPADAALYERIWDARKP